MQKKFLIIAGIITIILLGAAFGGLAYWHRNSNQAENSKTANWKTYTNTEYGFELEYSKNYNFKTPEEVKVAQPNLITDNGFIGAFYGTPDDIYITYKSGSILDLSSGKYGPKKIYFDAKTNQWMIIHSIGGDSPNTITEKLIPSYTDNNLPYFINAEGIGHTDIVPLSHNTFILISAADSGEIREIINNIATTFKITK